MHPAQASTDLTSFPRVLVLGASGFIGRRVAAALSEAGWQVVRLRRPGARIGEGEIACDLATMRAVEDWLPHLQSIAAVVNVAGILRETGADTFGQIHQVVPATLAAACLRCGVALWVQISALGDPRDGAFVASKHHGDQAVLTCLPGAWVLRPSVVYSPSGAYGGTALLRALAATPGAMLLPGRGEWRMQPMDVDDLARMVVAGLQRSGGGIYEVGGPAPITLREYQLAWRRWLDVPSARCVAVPELAVDAAVALGEWTGRGPLGRTTWRMLRRGNVLPAGAVERAAQALGVLPKSLDERLAGRPAQAQDRWHAQLYLLAPALKFSLVLLWLLSAWVGWHTPAERIHHLAAGSLLAEFAPVVLARASAALDLLLAICLLFARRPRLPLLLMTASVAVYTAAFGLLLPGLWRDPLGGLAKNLVVLPALAVMWVLAERR